MAEAAAYTDLFGTPPAIPPVVDKAGGYTDLFGTPASKDGGYTDLFGAGTGEAVPAEPGILRKLEYGFTADTWSSWENLGEFLDTYYPGVSLEFVRPSKTLKLMGAMITKDPELLQEATADYLTMFDRKKYGSDYNALTPDERRVRQKEIKNKQLLETYPDIFNTEHADSFGVGVGQFLSALDDPLTAVSLGKTAVESALRTSGLMMFDRTAYDLAKDGQVNVYATGLTGVAGLIAGPSLFFASKYLNKKAGEYITRKVDERLAEEANLPNKLIDTVNEYIIENRAFGMSELESINDAVKKAGTTSNELFGALLEKDRMLIIPKDMEMASDLYLGGSTRTSRVGGKTAQWIDDLIEPVQAGIRRISEPVWGRIMKYEANIRIRLHEALSEIEPLRKYVNSLPKETKELFNKHWLDQDVDTIRLFLRQDKDALNSFERIRPRLDILHKELQNVGYKDLEYIKNYLPRQLLDYETLVKKLPPGTSNRIDNAIAGKASRLGRDLTDLERADTINKALRGMRISREGPISASKERSFKAFVPDEWKPHYADWQTAYTLYLKKAIGDSEKRRMFGRHIKIDKEINAIDLKNTIGGLIDSDRALRMDGKAKERLRHLLESRFIIGEAPTNSIIQAAKNFIYTTTLSNLRNTLEQSRDIVQSFYKQGMFNTIKALKEEKFVRATDIGLSDIANELEQSAFASARYMERVMKASGFTTVDKFGKTVHINAAMHRIRAALAAPGTKEYNAFIQKYDAMFPGEEMVKLVDDLKAGNITHDVKTLLFTELSNVQPISKSSMPVQYLSSPRLGRLFYTLKTFQLTQLNFLREDILRQYAQGNIQEATTNLIRFMTYSSLLGLPVEAAKRIWQGQDIGVDDIPDMMTTNAIKVLGTSEYALAQTMRGKLSSVLSSQLELPIWSILNAAGNDTMQLLDGVFSDTYKMENGMLKEKPHAYKSLKYVPVAGDFLYLFLGGGLEKAAYEEKQKQKKEMKDLFKME